MANDPGWVNSRYTVKSSPLGFILNWTTFLVSIYGKHSNNLQEMDPLHSLWTQQLNERQDWSRMNCTIITHVNT